MLKIVIPGVELFDDIKEEFLKTNNIDLQLEHSLVSLSKWESKWYKPFLSKGDKTLEETLDYVRCMTLTQNVDELVYKSITDTTLKEIFAYIEKPMTATYFYVDKQNQQPSRETITSELIYYWMITFQIPFECQKWHLNRLLTLIDVCNRKNQPKTKMSASAIRARNRALNESRRAALNTKG